MKDSIVQANEWYLRRGASYYWLVWLFVFGAGVLLVVGPLLVAGMLLTQRVFGVLLLLCAVAMCIRQQTVVEEEMRIVRQHCRFLGLIPLWSRRFPFSEFESVVLRYLIMDHLKYEYAFDRCFVYLRTFSGRKLFIKQFWADRTHVCRPANDLTQRISTIMKINIDEYND